MRNTKSLHTTIKKSFLQKGYKSHNFIGKTLDKIKIKPILNQSPKNHSLNTLQKKINQSQENIE